MKARFGDFTLDSDSRQLLRAGQAVHLSRKAFDALCVLVARRPDAVTKEELYARLWPGTFVVDANLTVTIAELRRTLEDDPQEPRFIRTVHRVGYAFCAEASEVPGRGRQAATRRMWIASQSGTVPLAEGENLIGRDPNCAVWLDANGVSRRHARIFVDGDTAVLEDLGSKNGTSVGDEAVTRSARLRDGDRIQIGPVEVQFRSWSAKATATVRMNRRRS